MTTLVILMCLLFTLTGGIVGILLVDWRQRRVDRASLMGAYRSIEDKSRRLVNDIDDAREDLQRRWSTSEDLLKEEVAKATREMKEASAALSALHNQGIEEHRALRDKVASHELALKGSISGRPR